MKSTNSYRSYLVDPVVRTGFEASIRTAINAAISLADFFPGIGTLASWGADAAKVWARVNYARERARVMKEGGDPSTVKMSSVDLTPDVSVQVALFTEAIDVLTADLFPSHLIETSLQLSHDWSRIRDAIRRVQELSAPRSI